MSCQPDTTPAIYVIAQAKPRVGDSWNSWNDVLYSGDHTNLSDKQAHAGAHVISTLQAPITQLLTE